VIGRRPFAGGLATVLLTSATGRSFAQAPAPPLDVLFTAFAKSPGLYAKFHEEKQIALLVAPLKSDGTVHFDPKKGLARHTTSPSKRSLLLGGGTLTVWDGLKTEIIQLSSQPSLRAFAEAFTMFLAADRAGLERTFKLEFTGDPRAAWRLRLAPLSAQLKKIVAEMEVVGQGTALTTLRVSEASGDASTTSFSEVDAGKQYTPAEAATVFRVPRP
jgi:hypothetical protein